MMNKELKALNHAANYGNLDAFKMLGCIKDYYVNTVPTQGCCTEPPKPAKKENNMAKETYIDLNVTNTSTENNSVRDQRQFLCDRLWIAMNAQDHELQKKFNLLPDDPPQTYDEMRERLAKGLFVLPEKADKYYGVSLHSLVWRDPSKKEDSDGYAAAYKKLYAARAKVQEDIFILEPKEALESVRAFAAEDVNVYTQ